MPEITEPQLAYSIAKLDPQAGDILVFKFNYGPSKEEYGAIQRWLYNAVGGRCKFIVLSPDVEMEVIRIDPKEVTNG